MFSFLPVVHCMGAGGGEGGGRAGAGGAGEAGDSGAGERVHRRMHCSDTTMGAKQEWEE